MSSFKIRKFILATFCTRDTKVTYHIISYIYIYIYTRINLEVFYIMADSRDRIVEGI